jgi:hypothetical protein
MVAAEYSKASRLLIAFRHRPPWQQGAMVGTAFFVFYLGYSRLLLGFPMQEAFYASITAAILFAGVYFLTSTLIMRMESKVQKQSRGPKKGMRGK